MTSLSCRLTESFLRDVAAFYASSPTAPSTIVDFHAPDPAGDAAIVSDLLLDKDVNRLTNDDWRMTASRIFWLLPEAVDYYLPGMMASSLNFEVVDSAKRPAIDFDVLDGLSFYFTFAERHPRSESDEPRPDVVAELSSRTKLLVIKYFLLMAHETGRRELAEVAAECVTAALLLTASPSPISAPKISP
jgi:hypothetical protein